MKSYTGPPMTLGGTAAAHLRIVVWCREFRHQVEPDVAPMVQRYGAKTTVMTARSPRLLCLRFARG